MNFCFNPHCQKPQNPAQNNFCQNCGTKLLLREHYRARKPLGNGTYSRTFLAVDEDIPSKPFCVIKQFFPPTQGAEVQKAAELFQREAVQLDRLGNHPQIPRLLAYFQQDKRQYLVQEFIEGENLAAEVKKQGSFSGNKIIELLEQLLPVLEFVHHHQVIHRDIKPANIIRRSDTSGKPAAYPGVEGGKNELVLVGFGSSKKLPNRAVSGSMTTIGSPEYTAEEQLAGNPIFASDLYSLGVTCIELLTQMSPFKLRLGNAWAWREYLPRPIGGYLERILDKLLASDLAQRYQSAAEVLRDLERLQPTSWKCVETFAASDRVKCVAISPDSQILASGSEDNRIQLWYPGRGNSPEVLGNWMSAHSGWVQAIAFSPDGRLLITGSCDRALKVWDLGTKKLMRSLGDWFATHTGWVNAIAIDPTGNLVVSGSADCTIKIWTVSSGKQVRSINAHDAWVESVAIDPRGKFIASGSGDRLVKLWELSTGKPVATLAQHTDAVGCVAFSPDGQILASGSRDKTLKLWQVSNGEELTTLTHSDWIGCVAFSPRSPLVAAGTRNGAIALANPYTGESLAILKAHSAAVNSVAFSPNSEAIVSGSADGSIKIWQQSG